jgi:shikimate dehydrogenase
MEYGLIAERLGHSFSKEIHSKLADYNYELKELAPEDLAAFMLAKEFKAINVTIPYKAAVIPYLDEIDATAKEIGAVNTIVNKNGKLFGFNTDFAGMKAMILKSGIDIKNKKVLILGSGGTSKTAFAVANSSNILSYS